MADCKAPCHSASLKVPFLRQVLSPCSDAVGDVLHEVKKEEGRRGVPLAISVQLGAPPLGACAVDREGPSGALKARNMWVDDC
jgi:hypothetical protein